MLNRTLQRYSRIASALLLAAACTDAGNPNGVAGDRPQQTATSSRAGGGDSCAFHAESPAEPGSRNGVATQYIRVDEALDACRIATAKKPKDAREWFRLGRVLETSLSQRGGAEGRNEMLDAYRRSASLGDPRGKLTLARLIRDDDPVQADLLDREAMADLHQEATAGSAQAKVMLGHAAASVFLADDTIADEEREAYINALKLIVEGSRSGGDRLLFDMKEALQASGFCEATVPTNYKWNDNARYYYCFSELAYALEESRDPVVLYDFAMHDLRWAVKYIEYAQRAADQHEFDSSVGSASENFEAAKRRLQTVQAGNERSLAEMAQKQLSSLQPVEQAITNLGQHTSGQLARDRKKREDEVAAAIVVGLIGAVALMATARGPGGASQPRSSTTVQPLGPVTCVRADSFGLVYEVLC